MTALGYVRRSKESGEATGHIGLQRWHPFLPERLDRVSGDLVVCRAEQRVAPEADL